MRELSIPAASGISRISVGGDLGDIVGLVDRGRCLVVTDAAVRTSLGSKFPDLPTLVLDRGEEAKNMAAVGKIYEKLARMEADRSWWLVGIGGGMVCDIAGFAASTYLRGIHFGFAPTTVLAQVDASVGGKNGINFAGYKNIVGTFNQPEFVVCDLSTLATLPELEYRSGFAEIIKHAVIASEDYFLLLENNRKGVAARDLALLEDIIGRSVAIKAAVVTEDPREKGRRKVLNFGHTIGHGIELVCGLSHGQAVAVGIRAACLLSVERGILSAAEAGRIAALLALYDLPVGIDGGSSRGSSRGPSHGSDRETMIASVLDSVRHDKKRSGGNIDFVFPETIGSARIESAGFAEIKRAIRMVIV